MRIQQSLAVEHIDIEVVRMLAKVAIHETDEVGHALVIVLAQGIGNDGEGVGDTVLANP